jgi:hypothetical protein
MWHDTADEEARNLVVRSELGVHQRPKFVFILLLQLAIDVFVSLKTLENITACLRTCHTSSQQGSTQWHIVFS